MKNYTPLQYAAFKNSKEMGELLISKGATIKTKAKTLISMNLIFREEQNSNSRNMTPRYYKRSWLKEKVKK